GPKPKVVDAPDLEIVQLRKEKAMAEVRLKRAEALLEVQKKSRSCPEWSFRGRRTTRSSREHRNGGGGLAWYPAAVHSIRLAEGALLPAEGASAWSRQAATTSPGAEPEGDGS